MNTECQFAKRKDYYNSNNNNKLKPIIILECILFTNSVHVCKLSFVMYKFSVAWQTIRSKFKF